MLILPKYDRKFTLRSPSTAHDSLPTQLPVNPLPGRHHLLKSQKDEKTLTYSPSPPHTISRRPRRLPHSEYELLWNHFECISWLWPIANLSRLLAGKCAKKGPSVVMWQWCPGRYPRQGPFVKMIESQAMARIAFPFWLPCLRSWVKMRDDTVPYSSQLSSVDGLWSCADLVRFLEERGLPVLLSWVCCSRHFWPLLSLREAGAWEALGPWLVRDGHSSVTCKT